MKSVKTFLKTIKAIGEDVYISELKGANKLTEEQQSALRSLIAGMQNDMGEFDEEIWNKFKVKPYQG